VLVGYHEALTSKFFLQVLGSGHI